MNHYNGATVWGIVDKVEDKETENGKAYLEILVGCPHAVHGNVRVLGRIWGDANIKAFQADFRKGSLVRLEGNMQQYQGRNDVTRTNFNFFRFQPGPLKEMKAAFRLVGQVQGLNDDKLLLTVCPEAREGYTAKAEEIEVTLPTEVLLDAGGSPEPGQQVRVKGYMVQEEDEFGETTGDQRPVVKQMEILGMPEPAQDPLIDDVPFDVTR